MPKVGIKDLNARCHLVGNIEYLGPEIVDIASSFTASKRRSRTLVEHYPITVDLKTAKGLNEKLMTIVNEPGSKKIDHIMSYRSSGMFLPHTDVLISDPWAGATTPSPRIFLGTGVMMGVVPAEALIGYAVCQFWKTESSVVLRCQQNGEYTTVGRSGVLKYGNDNSWDVETTKYLFEADSSTAIDLTMDIFMLTRLSLDTVNLPYVS